MNDFSMLSRRWLTHHLTSVLFLMPLCAVHVVIGGEFNWTQFRGLSGNGRSSSTGLPIQLSETESVRWKTEIHGKAWSSPIIWGTEIWMTTANVFKVKVLVILNRLRHSAKRIQSNEQRCLVLDKKFQLNFNQLHF